MRIGVLSDTHGHAANTRRGLDVLAAQDVDAVLHCGDVGSIELIPLFAQWPSHFVLGNVDSDRAALAEAIEAAGQAWHGAFGDFTLSDTRIALLHSDDRRRFEATIQSGDYDLVCYGHTHVAECREEGKTLVLNPGALYRASRHSVAVVDLPGRAVEILDIQSGAVWLSSPARGRRSQADS